jgi:hypothetical protein
MVAAVNIDVNQKLPSSSQAKRPNVNSYLSKFGKKTHISANGTLIKTFSNHLFTSIDPTIFSKAKL